MPYPTRNSIFPGQFSDGEHQSTQCHHAFVVSSLLTDLEPLSDLPVRAIDGKHRRGFYTKRVKRARTRPPGRVLSVSATLSLESFHCPGLPHRFHRSIIQPPGFGTFLVSFA